MVNAGLIMTSSGAGAVVGIPLLAVGTICTAYSSGLINIDKNSKKISVNLTQHNAVEFGISMGLNAYDLGSEYNFINKFVKTKSIIKSIKCIQSEIKRDIQVNVEKLGLAKGYYKYTKNKVIGENKKRIIKEITKSYIVSKEVSFTADILT